MASRELTRTAASGFAMLFVLIAMLAFTIWMFVGGVQDEDVLRIILSIVLFLLFFLGMPGFVVVQPNEAAVLILFGAYKGTIKKNGFWWVNPFTVKRKISLRARNLDGDKLKVNDLGGNPVEIAAVVVWRVADTFSASFDVDDYEGFVRVQSDSAVRHLAKEYPYDEREQGSISLRGSTDEVSDALRQELQERVGRAGVVVDEARLSHLAYAPEIASAMLQRQQAEAIIAARTRIVEGAVSMVEMALDQLSRKQVVELDEERKATMISNLLVVLTSEQAAAPVVNAGTLYR
ncbi:MAG: SPFH domain-containing protein [Candidatus Latescibacterota bacterium]|nr:MAG: SPFH domain-containing protein [Candidatus Latescibacterota bacterium]